MALLKKKKKDEQQPSLDKVIDKKLCLYISIVNEGYANSVIDVLKHQGSSAQFVQKGQGTAKKEIRDILGIEDNGKDIVVSIITEDKVKNTKNALNAIFIANKKIQGIAFKVSLSSIIGVRVYQFLADIIKEN